MVRYSCDSFCQIVGYVLVISHHWFDHPAGKQQFGLETKKGGSKEPPFRKSICRIA